MDHVVAFVLVTIFNTNLVQYSHILYKRVIFSFTIVVVVVIISIILYIQLTQRLRVTNSSNQSIPNYNHRIHSIAQI